MRHVGAQSRPSRVTCHHAHVMLPCKNCSGFLVGIVWDLQAARDGEHRRFECVLVCVFAGSGLWSQLLACTVLAASVLHQPLCWTACSRPEKSSQAE